MRLLFSAIFLNLMGITSVATGQYLVAAPSITALPHPAGSSPNPAGTYGTIDLSGGTSIIYQGEDFVRLVPSGGTAFRAKASTGSGSSYFIARIATVSYAELKEKLDGSYYPSIGGRLYFKYIEKYTEGTTKYQIYNYQRMPMVSGGGTISNRVVGSNFCSIDLTTVPGLVADNELNSYYILEVTNDKGDVQMIRFKYLLSTR